MQEKWSELTVRFAPQQFAVLKILAHQNDRSLAAEVRDCVDQIIMNSLLKAKVGTRSTEES